jgi:type I restriction enzyme S subunit
MKAGWKTHDLGDLCDVIGGGTPSKDKAHAAFYSGDIPWATVRDMKGDFISETEFKITKAAVASSSTNVIPKNNVVIATRVGLGKVCMIEQDTAINQDLRGIVPKNKNSLAVPYLYWWLKSVSHVIVAEGTGATVQGVKLPFIKSLQVPTPALPEQQRIVTILDEAFEGIAAAAANAEKNLSNARGVFDSHLKLLFTDGSTGWGMHPLKDVALTFGRGKSRHRPRNEPMLYGGKYPFIQTGDIRNCDHFITEFTQTYSEAGLAQSKLWPKGTLCITIAANIAETGILTFDSCFPDSVIGFVADPAKSDVHFVEYLLGSFKARLQAKGKGSAQDNLNLASFENELFPFPSVKQQKTIAAELDELSAHVVSLESVYQQKIDALAELKKSILHQAFTGQLH